MIPPQENTKLKYFSIGIHLVMDASLSFHWNWTCTNDQTSNSGHLLFYQYLGPWAFSASLQYKKYDLFSFDGLNLYEHQSIFLSLQTV